MKLRSLAEFEPLLNLDNVTCLPEQEFFERLEDLADTQEPTTIISHCMDQVSGFQHYDKIKLLNQIAKQQKHLTFIVISVNKLDLCNEVVYYYFPEYHAIYWPLYKSKTPTYRLNDVTHKYLCLNKRGDPWRQVLYKKFWKDDLLKHSHFSYLCEDDNYGTLFHEPTWEANRKWADEDFIPRFMPELAGPWPEDKFIELPDDSLLDQYKTGQFNTDDDPTWTVDYNLVDTSFCSIVIETDIGNELVNISEKTIKALALGHPLLLLGVPGTHQYLKDLGFDLLDDIFDNSFDQEPETYARFCKFVSSIDKINQSTVGALQHSKCSVKKRLESNRTRVKTLNKEMHQRAKEIVQDILHKLNN